MKILVTGGLGYIGSHLVKQLESVASIEQIVLYDNLMRKNYGLLMDQAFKTDKVQFIEGDILDGRKLQKAIESIDLVIHLAAKATTPFANTEPEQFDQINLWGTAQLVSAIEQSDVKRVVFLSSASVYGNLEEPGNEQTLPKPNSFYGISKLDAEKEIQRLSTKLDYHILRCANVYGYSPALRTDSVVNRFMVRANYHNRIRVTGGGEQMRPFIHIDKLSKALIKLLEKPDIPSGIYNLVERNLSINEVVDFTRKLYPQLETIYVNTDYKDYSLLLETPCQLMKLLEIETGNFLGDLERFKAHFSF